MPKTALEQIEEIRKQAEEQIAKLKGSALEQLLKDRRAAADTLAGIDSAIAELTGKTVKAGRGAGKPKGLPDVPSESALKNLLKGAPDKTLNRKGINDAGYNLASALAIAKGNKDTFSFRQNKSQGSITLK